MLAVTFDVLVHPTVTFVKVVLFGHFVGAAMSHVVIVTDPLLLFIPATEPM